MTKIQPGPFTVRRLDDDEQFVLEAVQTYHDVYDGRTRGRTPDGLLSVVSPDGRGVYTPDEKNFYFEDEPDRPMQIVDH